MLGQKSWPLRSWQVLQLWELLEPSLQAILVLFSISPPSFFSSFQPLPFFSPNPFASEQLPW